MRSAQNEMNKSYRKLKKDYLADEGKKLYSEGKRMSGYNNLGSFALRQSFIVTGSKAVGKYLFGTGKLQLRQARQVSGVMIAGATAVNTVMYGVSKNRNKKLSAYYAH